MKKIDEGSFGLQKKNMMRFSAGLLCILFSITGCTDMPYIGSVRTLEVDRYLVSTDGQLLCFQDESDSTCVSIIPGKGYGKYVVNGHKVHLYPEERVYVFYHEGNPILRAERTTIQGAGDPSGGDLSTSNAGGGNNNGNGNRGNNNGNNGNSNNNGDNNGNDNNNGNSGNNNGNDNNNGNNAGNNNNADNGNNNNNGDDNSGVGHGWLIWVYYPEGAALGDSPTLSGSGVAVTLNGKQLTDDDITGFAQFTGASGEHGIQFFYPTDSPEFLELRVRVEGVVSDDENVKFNINYLWKSQ